MENIKNIIFDFGGVILTLKPEETERALSRVFGQTFKIDKLSKKHKEILESHETGSINDETLLWHLQREFNPNANPRDLINAWNAMLIDIPKDNLDTLLGLRNDYRLFLMSNTNGIHIEWVHNFLRMKYGCTDFEKKYFERVYYSHEMGMRKPNRAIFKEILKQHNLKPNETLFVDDLKENLAPAEQIGINSYLFPRNSPLGLEIKKMLKFE